MTGKVWPIFQSEGILQELDDPGFHTKFFKDFDQNSGDHP